MKKLVLFMFAACIISVGSVSAQQDLTIGPILNCVPGSTQEILVDSVFTWGVTNSGTTTWNGSDTLIFGMYGDASLAFTLIYNFIPSSGTVVMAPGDAIALSTPGAVSWNDIDPMFTTGAVNVCVLGQIRNGGVVSESDTTNNVACAGYTLQMSTGLDNAITLDYVTQFGKNLYLNFTDGMSDGSTVDIYNLSGQIVKSLPINASTTKVISVADLAKGVYIVRLGDNERTWSTTKIAIAN